MKCNKCGKELKNGAKFCSGCGHKLVETQQDSQLNAAPIANSSQNATMQNGKKKKPKKKKTVVFLSVVLIVVFICVGGIFAYQNGIIDYILPLLPAQETLSDSKDSVSEEEASELEESTEAAEPTEAAAEPTEKKEEPTEEPTQKTAVEPIQSAIEQIGETIETTENESTKETMESKVLETTAPEPSNANTEDAATDANTTPAYQQPKPSPASASDHLTQKEKIEYIREVYNRTHGNLENFEVFDGKYYNDDLLVMAEALNGNPVLDEAMQDNGYSTYYLEYYYDDQSSENAYPIFIYALIDGKEYRYYFQNGSFIRRVGPEGGVNDSPKENSFITALKDEGASYR